MSHAHRLPRVLLGSIFLYALFCGEGCQPAFSNDTPPIPSVGWIPVQMVSCGTLEKYDLTRWLDPGPKGAVELVRNHPNSGIQATVTKDRFLIIQALPTSTGIENLILRATPTKGPALEAILTVAIQPAPAAQFKFFGTGSEKSVAVAGSFNQWNPSFTPLKKTSQNQWELSLPLAAGSYPYKYFIDGKWSLDPTNREKVSDGSGNQNSLLIVSPPTPPLFLYPDVRSPDSLTFAVAPAGHPTERALAVAEMPDGSSKEIPADPLLKGRWKVSTQDLPPLAWVRLMAVGADGVPTLPGRARAGVDPTPGADRHDLIMYMAFIDRMVDGDPSNNPQPDSKVEPPAQYYGGDLIGLRQMIEEGYFEKLGVNTLWLSPVNQNPLVPYQEFKEPRRWYTGYHGYWPTSSTEVEKRFGGENALADLAAAAKKRGLHLLLDLVLAHVHEEHPAYREHPNWFGSLILPDGTKNLRKWDNDTQFTTWFEPFLPRFNYDNLEACSYLIENAANWVQRFDLDGFRLDAVKHIPPKFWTLFRQGLRSRLPQASLDSFYLVGETFMDRKGINSFIGPNRLDGQFEFPLYDSILATFGMGTEDFSSLEASALASDRVFGPESTMSPLLGNHDKSRFLAYADGDLPDLKEPDEFIVGWNKPPKVDHSSSYAKLRLAFTFVLTCPGVPMIYYGDEVGMTGAQDPDNRRMFPDLKKLSPEEKRVQDHVAKLNAIRTAHPAIRYGSRRCLVAGKETYGVARAYLQDRVLIIYNRSDQAVELTLEVSPEFSDGSLTDHLGSLKNVAVKKGKTSLRLPPLSSHILTAE